MEVSGIGQGGLNFNTGNMQSADSLDIKPINGSGTVGNHTEKSTAKSEDKAVNEKEVHKAVDKLNKLFEDKSTHVQYEIYGKLRAITIKIVDDNTNEVIKEIPPKKLIDMVDRLCELAGVLVDEKA